MAQNIYGVDIGTSNLKMCCNEKGRILNEKNIIAIANKKERLAFGDEASVLYGICKECRENEKNM